MKSFRKNRGDEDLEKLREILDPNGQGIEKIDCHRLQGKSNNGYPDLCQENIVRFIF
jgi:hypothetical protein